MRRIRNAIAAGFFAILAVPLAGYAQPIDLAFDGIVGFGDSLSDPGNVFIVTGEQSHAPYAPIPIAPYAIGGHHFSNGATWIERLAQMVGDPPGGKPAFRQPSFSNYAFGGARARPAGVSPDFSTQVAAYLSQNGGADGNALHALWFGSNDARDALTMLQAATTPADVAAALSVIPQAVQAIADNIMLLHSAGARFFLVGNLPNLAILPAIQAQGEPAISTGAFVSASFNGQLEAALNLLDGLEGIEIVRLDIWSRLNAVYAAPGAFGLENSTTPCLSFFVIQNPICEKPQTYLFWDVIHPTTATHGILADYALGTLMSP